MTRPIIATTLALVLLLNPGSTRAGDRTFTVTPNADGSYTLRESRSGAGWPWSGTLSDGRAYRVIAEPSAGSRMAYVAFGDGTTAWVPAGDVCPDADWLMRMSAACR